MAPKKLVGRFMRAEDFQRVLVLMVCTPAAAVLVGLLKARTMQALRRERDGTLRLLNAFPTSAPRSPPGPLLHPGA